VIDASNPIEPPTFQPVDLHGRLSTEVVSHYVPGARLVKAFNHLSAKLLGEDPRVAGGRRVLFFAGADAEAKSQVAALIEKLGFFGVDLGEIDKGGRAINVPSGSLTTLNLVRFE
jgi:predicted dinucleotide-binding enzyme